MPKSNKSVTALSSNNLVDQTVNLSDDYEETTNI